MRRIFVNGTALSEPGTMGGNTKIFLEILNHFDAATELHVVLPEAKVKTVTDNVPLRSNVFLHPFPTFMRSEFRHPVACVRYYYKQFTRILDELHAGVDDLFFSASDFHCDSVVSFFLQRRFGFKWFPSAFLFVPNPVENIRKGYGFPPFLYTVAWSHSLVFLVFALMRATAFVITNEADFRHFPKRWRNGRLFPFYGGVNIDQIPKGPVTKTRDVVFCSRLCVQKGINGFLDVWKIIHEKVPSARFTLIGNGAPSFERMLHEKAERLGVADSIDWMGYVNNEKKYEIYRSARVMVHPTVFDNNGMVAAEALCSGIPVVMYDLPALRKVYSTGCIKVPYGDKKAFADAVVRLLTDTQYATDITPSESDVDGLRAHWDWSFRVARFSAWLNNLKS